MESRYINNKYFTPAIEDLRVGYECEMLQAVIGDYWDGTSIPPHEWLPFKISEFSLHMLKWDKETIAKYIRVPYLTKEQIEAEGWSTPDFMVSANNDVMDTISPLIKRPFGNILYCRQFGTLIKISEYGNNTLFIGECKDITTFRYICKLLGIS